MADAVAENVSQVSQTLADIKERLEKSGYSGEMVKEHDKMQCIKQMAGQIMAINGQKCVQSIDLTIIFEFLGEGEILSAGDNSKPLLGFRIIMKQDGYITDDSDFWIEADINEFNKTFKNVLQTITKKC